MKNPSALTREIAIRVYESSTNPRVYSPGKGVRPRRALKAITSDDSRRYDTLSARNLRVFEAIEGSGEQAGEVVTPSDWWRMPSLPNHSSKDER